MSASIVDAIARIKRNVAHCLTREAIVQTCHELKHGWREREQRASNDQRIGFGLTRATTLVAPHFLQALDVAPIDLRERGIVCAGAVTVVDRPVCGRGSPGHCNPHQ